jgi:hypothetical protein
MCATSVAERQVRFAVAILVAVLVATACSQRGPEAYDDVLPSPAQDEDGADTDEDTEDADEPESEDGLDLDERDDTYLFDQSKLHTFDIELSEADLAILDADPVAEEYVPGTLRFENETIAVGVRYKGSIVLTAPNCSIPPGRRPARSCHSRSRSTGMTPTPSSSESASSSSTR